MPKLRCQTFETAIIERYRHREALIEESDRDVLGRGIVRRVENITQALWGTRVMFSYLRDNTLSVAPINIVETTIMQMVRFPTNDDSGKSILVTCSKLDNKMIINESQD